MSERAIVTTKCSRHGHPEFTLSCDSSAPMVDVQALASFLEESVGGGARYVEGEFIAVGSMLLRVTRINDTLAVEEPDLVAMPIEWTPGVTRTIRLVRLQRDITESVGLEGEIDPPSIRSSLLVGADVTRTDNDLVLARGDVCDGDTGWFIGRRDSLLTYDDQSNLTRISVYQAMLHWPIVGGLLALPAGCRVEMSSREARITREGRNLEIKSGSYLDTLGDEPDSAGFIANWSGPPSDATTRDRLR